MITLYVALGLTLVALILAALALRATVQQPIPDPLQPALLASAAMAGGEVSIVGVEEIDAPSNGAPPGVFRVGFALVVLIVALIAPLPFSVGYKAGIGAALLILVMLEAFMAIPGSPTILRTGTNVPLYGVLWITFAAATGGAFWSWWGLLVLLPLALGAIFVWQLRNGLSYLRITVIAYTVNGALVVAFASTLAATHLALWSIFALLGALLIVAADMVEGWHRFRKNVVRRELYQLICLAGGSLLLAWSTWGEFLPRF